MRIYISGAMSGLPDLNFPAFHAEAQRLRAQGLDVVNPAEINPIPGNWATCMRRDIRELVTCDAIRMLRGWEHSRGAKLEFRIALELGFTVSFADGAAVEAA